MNTYHLSIITPNGKVFDDQVESLVAPGAAGSLGILAGHAPIVVSLKNGLLAVKKENEERFYAISAGILEVSGQNRVLVLSDYAVEYHSLEEAKQHTTSSNTN